MPPPYSQHNPSRQSTSARMPTLKEPQQSRPPSSAPRISSSQSAKTGSTRTPPAHGPQSPQRRGYQPLVQPSHLRYEETQVPSIKSKRHSHHSKSKSSTQQQTLPVVRAGDILSNPRLQQVTGLLPSKVDIWGDREFPPDELCRLAWAMTLPEPFPSKRPAGEISTPKALKSKKW